ncbi:helix-turn-helix domain-containing protein, partial [Burkholderia multivorans]|uniref:helix-turn-helix domain-containing protein n=1 Tax=Burkholderia multivorans TaxID=87883 RepID=UPI001C65E2C4
MRGAGALRRGRLNFPRAELRSRSNGTQSIDRAAETRARVVTADEPISYTDVVEATSLARSTVSRLLSALER